MAEKQAYEAALQGYRRRLGKRSFDELTWINELMGQTHRSKLVLIARYSKNSIRIGHAADLLYVSGLIACKKRASAYRMNQLMLAELESEGIFRKVGREEYILANSWQLCNQHLYCLI